MSKTQISLLFLVVECWVFMQFTWLVFNHRPGQRYHTWFRPLFQHTVARVQWEVEQGSVTKGNQQVAQPFKHGHQDGARDDLCNNSRNGQDCIVTHYSAGQWALCLNLSETARHCRWNCFPALTWAVSQYTMATLKCCYELHSYRLQGLSSAMTSSFALTASTLQKWR